MKYWKEHPAARLVLMLATFVPGFVLLVYGWGLTGQMKGLGLMLAGLALLLTTLYLYNSRFADPPRKNKH